LEFSTDLALEVEKIADEYSQSIPTQSNVNKMKYIEKCMNSPFVPAFARELFQQSRETIEQQLATDIFDPIADIKKQTASISRLCHLHITSRNFS